MKVNISKVSLLDCVSIAVILALISYFYFQFFTYTANIPVNDDYKAILEFINKFKGAESFAEKIKLMLAQHNEHRIFYDRLWTLVSYKIYGTVNFNFLALIGNLSYLVFFVLLSLPVWRKGFVYLIPIAVLIFNFSFHENITFPMATLSNNTGLLFIVASIYFATKEGKSQYWSLLFYVLSVLTVGSGMFLTVLLPLVFLYKKQKKMALVFVALAVVTLALYFMGYQKPPQTPDIFETLVAFKVKAVLFFFCFVGNISSFYLIFTNDINDSVVLSAMLGVLVLVFYGYLVWKQYYKQNLFVFATLTFMLIAAGLTSITRTPFGIETAIASRYRLYSAIIIICCYCYAVEHARIKNSLQYGLIGVISLFYFVNVSYAQLEYLDYRQSLNYIGAINYQSGNHKLLNGFEQDAYKVILEESKNYQTYELPKEEIDHYFPVSKQAAALNQANNTDKWFTQGVEQIYELKDSFIITGKGFLDGEPTAGQKIYLELENGATKNTMTFETIPVKRYDMNPYFKKNNLDYGGFSCRIPKSLLDGQEYTIKLSIVNDKLFKKEITDKKIKKTY
ncbi:hypothetical protein [Flavobacterium sp.]|uniref:hypothetical protein n=1 Tax=Flavobacterium sp. TaxID=239 RepID=UPI0039E35444